MLSASTRYLCIHFDNSKKEEEKKFAIIIKEVALIRFLASGCAVDFGCVVSAASSSPALRSSINYASG